MDISNWTVEDFVLDQRFVDDVLNPTTESSRYWEALLEKNAHKKEQARQARVIVLRMKATDKLSDQDKRDLWGRVEVQILGDAGQSVDEDMPSKADLPEKKTKKTARIVVPQAYRVAAILCLAVGLSWIVNLSKYKHEEIVQPEPIAYVEHRLPPGVKS